MDRIWRDLSYSLHLLIGVACFVSLAIDHSGWFAAKCGMKALVVEIGSLLGPTGALLSLYVVTLGHNYPVWTTFGGGTGLGVILGATIALDPTLGIICLSAWTFSYYSFANRTAAAPTSFVATPITTQPRCCVRSPHSGPWSTPRHFRTPDDR